MRTVLALVLLLCPAPPTEDQAPPAEDRLLLVPVEMMKEGDERSLDQLLSRFTTGVLDLENRAIELEEQLAGPDTGAASRAQRVQRDRELIRVLVAAAAEPFAPGVVSQCNLPLRDRFLFSFALERLRTDGCDRELFEAWAKANLAFLTSSDLTQRDLALERRDQALKGAQATLVLRAVITAISRGPLSDGDRKQFLARLETYYGDSELTSLNMLAATVPGPAPIKARLPPPDPNLPRLDGVVHPFGTLSSVHDLSALAPPKQR